MTDWKALRDEMGGNFKNYAEDGDYKAKCDSIEIKEVGQNGSIIMKFGFEATDVQFPTADHWLTFKEGKENWRKWHNRCLMIVLGASEEAAEKAVDVCEGKSGKENIVKAYEQAYKKLVAKKPEVEIEVYTENDYARAEFKDRSVNMNNGNKKENKENKSDDVLAGAEEVDLSDADLPF